MRLGVYVGSFNPVHKGHIKVANYLVDNNVVDKVLILATPNYWHKQNLIDTKDRVNMLKFFETDKIIVDDVHNKYEYTYQILENLQKDYPNDELYLVVGSDNVENMPMWKNFNEIIKHNIIVLKRGDIDVKDNLDKFNKNKVILINDFDSFDVSSTEIRNDLDNEYLDDRVRSYIINNRLFELWSWVYERTSWIIKREKHNNINNGILHWWRHS